MSMRHRLEHLTDLVAALYGKDSAEAGVAEARRKDWLEGDDSHQARRLMVTFRSRIQTARLQMPGVFPLA